MPTYEYECSRCSLVFEEFKPMSAPKRQRCPECRGKVERLISGGTGILFKGSGFYINDSRGKTRETGKASAEAQSSAAEKAPTKSKPEAKANDTNKGQKNKA